MRRRLLLLLTGLAVLAAPTGTAAADGGGRPLSTTLTGAAEVPGPGDPDASGQIDIKLNQGQGEVCFVLDWADVDGTVVAAHIHEAPAGSPGPIVVPLFAGSLSGTGGVSDCVEADRALIKAIRMHPADYYVNVHSTPGFEAGAIRGQLG